MRLFKKYKERARINTDLVKRDLENDKSRHPRAILWSYVSSNLEDLRVYKFFLEQEKEFELIKTLEL